MYQTLISPYHLAINNSAYIIGPAIGYLLGGVTLAYYVDFNRISEDKIPSGFSRSDPRWIGAWWIGFLGVGICLFLAARPTTLMPTDASVNYRVPDGDTNVDGADDAKKDSKQSKPRPGG